MTHARIIELLDALALELANHVPPPEVRQARDAGRSSERHATRDAEWAYVKGLASERILQLRADLILQHDGSTEQTPRAIDEQHY